MARKKFDGEAFPWVEDDLGTWHIRPRTDRWTPDRHDQARTICGRRVSSEHVSEVAPHSLLSMCPFCRVENWRRAKPLVHDAPGYGQQKARLA